MQHIIDTAFGNAQATLTEFLANRENTERIRDIANLLARVYRDGGKAIIFGNGGSMCDAMHFAEELTGRFRLDRPALPAIAISDPSHITCVGNDYGFDLIFARGVEAYAKPDDVVIGISTSGNSPNIIKALERAQELGCFTVSLLGKDGGALKGCCDYELIVSAPTTDRVQEVHTMILHILIECLEHALFYNNENTANQD